MGTRRSGYAMLRGKLGAAPGAIAYDESLQRESDTIIVSLNGALSWQKR